MAMMHTGRPGPVRRLVRWLCGAPFQRLPPQYGDTVPPEMRAFEDQAARNARGRRFDMAPVRHEHTHPARLDSWMERQ
jgi:hypothetical protein